jgi:hypothetical protein
MLKDILAISGKPGLYRLVSQTNKGIVVEALDTKHKTLINNSYKVSTLKDIAIFTENDEKPLEEVFKNIHKIENGNPTSISDKAKPEEIKSYFEKVVPDYDKDRVYVSDMKKVIKWYNILQQHNLLKVEEEENKEENQVAETEKEDNGK